MDVRIRLQVAPHNSLPAKERRLAAMGVQRPDIRHSGGSRNPVKLSNWMPDQVRHDELINVP